MVCDQRIQQRCRRVPVMRPVEFQRRIQRTSSSRRASPTCAHASLDISGSNSATGVLRPATRTRSISRNTTPLTRSRVASPSTVFRSVIEPIRARRRELEEDGGEVLGILRRGTMRAGEVAGETLSEVKRALGLTYFQSCEAIFDYVALAHEGHERPLPEENLTIGNCAGGENERLKMIGQRPLA
ncbi:hypothetical protein BH160DRAFT_3545 [Burkholderia sp. H160]|nr:hypothetical protein BH160DRAFT_3545 [Burkholderia sp. H160]